MIEERSRRLITIAFFTIWTGILYLGADHPPPIGFLWLVLLCFIAAVAVYVRIPVYADWSIKRQKHRFLRVFIEGCIAGLLFAVIPILFNWNGEPSVQPTWIDGAIWFLVLAMAGCVNAAAVYACAAWVNRLTSNAQHEWPTNGV